MKLGEFLKAKSPITGDETSLTDVTGIFQMVLGVVLLLFVVATGQNVARAVSSKFSRIDTTPNPIFANQNAGPSSPAIL